VKEGNYIYLHAFCVHVSKSNPDNILNWNCAHDTMEAIRSVYASKVEPYTYDIFLVDNGSKDDSVQKLRAFFASEGLRGEEVRDEQTTIAEKGTKKIFFYISPVNTGFAGGNNIGMRFALKNGYDFVFLLNADAVVSQDCIKVLVETMKKDASIGIAGPKVYYYDFHGKKNVINFAGGKIDMWRGIGIHIGQREEDHGQYDKIYDVDYVEGSAFMVKSSVLAKVGVFDENYFAYWEESDLCMRARKGGFRVIFVGHTSIWHKVSATLGTATHKRNYYLLRNSLYFMKKHGKSTQQITASVHAIYLISRILIRNLIKEHGRDFRNLLVFSVYGILDFIREKLGFRHT